MGKFYAFASGVYAVRAAFIESTKILYVYIAFVEFCIALLFPTVSTLVSNKVGEKVQGETLV